MQNVPCYDQDFKKKRKNAKKGPKQPSLAPQFTIQRKSDKSEKI